MSYRSQLSLQFVIGLAILALSLYLVPTIAMQEWASWVTYAVGLPVLLLGVLGLALMWEAFSEFWDDVFQGGAK